MVLEDFEDEIDQYSSDFSAASDLDELYDWRQVGEDRKYSYESTASQENDYDENADSLMDLLDSIEIDPETNPKGVKVPVTEKSKPSDFTFNTADAFNPFIPTTAPNKKSSNLMAESMVPDLPSAPVSNSPYQKIIQDAANRQREAQALFRSMSSVSSPVSPVSPSLAIPKRGNSLLSPTEKSPFGDLAFKSPVSPLSRARSPIYDEVTARQERLASLGIFDVSPQSKLQAREARRISLQSFSTPPHQKPVMFEKDIKEITSPQLISTSSKMQTVPISEILKDLKAAGRLVEENGDKKKKRNYFRRQS